MPKQTSISITNRTIIRIIVVAMLTFLGLAYVRHITHILELLVIAAFLAIAINPLSRFLERWAKLSRSFAVAGASISILALLLLFLYLVVPPFVTAIGSFAHDFPGLVRDFQSSDSFLAHQVRDHQLDQKLIDFAHSSVQNPERITNVALTILSRLLGSITAIVTVAVLTIMLLLEGPAYTEYVWSVQSSAFQQRYRSVAAKMYQVVTAYFNGQVIISLIGGAAAFIALEILRVPNALALAGVVAVTGLIPLIGHPVGAALVTAVVFFGSFNKALIIALFFLVYLQLQNISIQPYIQSKKNELTPLTVFVSAIIGIELAGFLGAFLMIPLVACLRLLVIDYLAHHHQTLDV